MTKDEQLQKLKKRMEEDTALPLRNQATQLVFGEGNSDADIYMLGEAPGYFEDKKGRPFVGQAGQLLDKLIIKIGLIRADVYISNVVRFRPPENRDPTPEELAAFDPYINEEIKIIDPKIIVTLGRFSMAKFIPDVKISQVHGKPRRIEWNGKPTVVIPMYHPAAALRSTNVLKMLEEDFYLIPKFLKPEQETEKKLDPQSENKVEKQQLKLL